MVTTQPKTPNVGPLSTSAGDCPGYRLMKRLCSQPSHKKPAGDNVRVLPQAVPSWLLSPLLTLEHLLLLSPFTCSC